MMVDSPATLFYSLVGVTLLGAVMGFCVALLRAKKQALRAIDAVRAELTNNRSAVELDLQSVRAVSDDLRRSLLESREREKTAVKREEALDLHSQLQAQRIQTLESQVAFFEDQQFRLKRDFASYKSNKSRELELARNKPDYWSGASELPVLQKRIMEYARAQRVSASVHRLDPAHARRTPFHHTGGLSAPLSRELDIPSLSESELPDSVDGLEFELAGLDGTGEWPSG